MPQPPSTRNTGVSSEDSDPAVLIKQYLDKWKRLAAIAVERMSESRPK